MSLFYHISIWNADIKADVTDLVKQFNKFNVFTINTDSIQYKFHEISFLLDNLLADIVVVKESKLDDSKDDFE